MALPLYPQVKRDLEDFLLDLAKNSARQQLGPFMESPRHTQHEGSRHTFNTVDGVEDETEYHEFKAEQLLSSSEIANLDFGDALKLVIEKGRELGQEEARYHFRKIDEIVTQIGNTVSGPLTVETFFASLEKMFFTFDMQGNPRLPTIVVPPGLESKLQQLHRDLDTDESKTRFARLIELKREQWNEEQNRRKLVD
jgi:hypothetical protein